MPKLEDEWLSLSLLCVVLIVAASGVAAAQWVPAGLGVAWAAAVGGVLAGAALAKTRFGGFTATLFALVYGAFTVSVLISLNMLQGDWHRRSLELVVRLNNFLYKVLHGGASRDLLPFPVLIGLLFWAFGVLGAWAVIRHRNAWLAVLPAGLGLLVNTYYYLGPISLDLYFAVYILLALMLVAHMSLLTREHEWHAARVAFSRELRLDFLRAGLLVALFSVTLGWAMPSLAASPNAAATWRQMTSSFGFIREAWVRLFSGVRGYGEANTDFFGDSLALAGPSRLSAEPIMNVTVNALADDNGALDVIPRYYWRAAAYGAYADGRWQLGDVTYRDYKPGETQFTIPTYAQRREVTLSIVPFLAASSRLYAAGQPRWTDAPSLWEAPFDASNTVDATGLKAQQVLGPGTPYRLIVSVSTADQKSLREAGGNYPGWVKELYLALPTDITQRTRNLARQIAREAGATTPYDQAQAITNWLRANMQYNQEIASAPPEVDPVDYFLFTSQEGYCNYYASAMVVMLRSLNIPARLAVGFTAGNLNAENKTYEVLQENAHAWPEVYFPKYGWVEFEPTASQNPIARPIERPVGADDGTDSSTNPDNDNRDDFLPDEDLENITDAEQNNTNPPSDTASTMAFWERLPLYQITLGSAGLAAGLGLGLIALFRVRLVGWESFGTLGAWMLALPGQPWPALRLWWRHRRRSPAVLSPLERDDLLNALYANQPAQRPISRAKPYPQLTELVYMHLERVTHWLGLSAAHSLTPHERAEALNAKLPGVETGVHTITAEYVAERYSPRPADGPTAQDAWRAIRFKVWHDALVNFLLRHLEEDELLAAARHSAQTLKRE